MNCPNCNKEIADEANVCPECGAPAADSPENVKETGGDRRPESKKEYTHYKIILINPGPREGTTSLLAEITGYSLKEVNKRLKNTPWDIATRIPLNKAQEYKVLLETNRAVVRLEGIDIWEEEIRTQKTSPSTAHDKPDKKRLLFVLLPLVVIVLAGLLYLVTKLDTSNRQGFLSKLNPEIRIKEQENIIGRLPSGAQLNIDEPPIEFNPYNLRDEGPNPFTHEIGIRFNIPQKANVSVILYDKSFSKISVLLQGALEAESYRIRWSGITESNKPVAPGVYIVRLNTPVGSYYHKFAWIAAPK